MLANVHPRSTAAYACKGIKQEVIFNGNALCNKNDPLGATEMMNFRYNDANEMLWSVTFLVGIPTFEYHR